MRFIYACFKGYIGFLNGLELDKLEIDFTKCRNNIILIQGINGSGKSTLLEALTPFPDPSSSYVPNKDAEKILTLFHQGDTYNIDIVSPCDNKGGRKQTKAFIKKNGIELNSNGNVTSYRDIIFSEFELDFNYISLTKLSSTDRGLGDKTPAERKKFVSSNIDNLEAYNNIYKTLNKKSLIFKSHINNIHTKIQNIGNKDNLEMTLNALKQKSDMITGSIQSLNNKIIELQTINSINQEEMNQIQSLKNDEDLLQGELDSINVQISLLQKKTKISMDNIKSKYNDDIELLNTYSKANDNDKNLWRVKSDQLSNLVSSVNELRANNDSYKANLDEKLENRYISSENNIKSLINDIRSAGYSEDSDITEISNMIDFYGRFIKKIDLLYDGMDLFGLEYISILYDADKLKKINESIESNKNEIINIDSRILILKNNALTLAVLNNRPKTCKDDTCYFIAEAVKLKEMFKSLDNIDKEINKLEKDKEIIKERIVKQSEEKELYEFYDKKYLELCIIINEVKDNIHILSKYNINKSLVNETSLRKLIASGSLFNSLRDPRRTIDALNNLKSLQNEINIFNVLKVEYESYKTSLNIISKNEESILNKQKDIEEITKQVSKLKNDIDQRSSLIDSLNLCLADESKYLDYVDRYNDIMSKLIPVKESIKKIESKSSESVNSIIQINNMNNEIAKLTEEVKPINQDIQRISGQLLMLESYYNEYELYKAKYDTIETLKKYCSPTGGGIQALFMQLYMSKTLDIANQILGMLFNGDYRLLDFVINQTEFRIPFIGLGLPVDDISSGSASQIAMMGMAINLALFYQASNKFNIIRLDEADGPLDGRNRYEFIAILYKIIPLLNIEQLFLISHSMEADTTSVDIIKLKSYNDFENNIQFGNIIYDYSAEK